MRIRTLALAAALMLTAAGAAMAQSHQGGYLGLNPGKDVPVSHGLGIIKGSGQGGYLGENVGDNLPPPTQPLPREFGSGQGGYLGLIPGAPVDTH